MMPSTDSQAAQHAGGWIVLGGLFLLACYSFQYPNHAAPKLMPGTSIQLGIDVNRASAEELACIPGVGVQLAQRIVSFREDHGPFQSLNQLEQVPGIGSAKAAQLAESLLPLDVHPTHVAASPAAVPARADR